jgi:hypothetical protein
MKVVGLLDTSEVLTENGWQPFHLTLPTATESHCVVSLNSTTIMFIGGFENEKNSYYFNSYHEEWVKGKRLSTFRYLNTTNSKIIRKTVHFVNPLEQLSYPLPPHPPAPGVRIFQVENLRSTAIEIDINGEQLLKIINFFFL